MTQTYTADTRFAYITRLTKHGTTFVACGGTYRRLLVAVRASGGGVGLSGVSEDLGEIPVDVVSNGTPSAYYTITKKGVYALTAASAPVITGSFLSPTGDSPWLLYTASARLLVSQAFGGVRLMTTAGVTLQDIRPGISESTAAALSGVNAYIFDGQTGRLATLTVGASTLTFEGTITAPNCREILRAVVDGANLFCLCRHRIVRFDITVPSAPVFAQDYGKKTEAFSDMGVITSGNYWLGFQTATPSNTGPQFFGPLYGVWDVTNSELQAAAPKMSAWTVNNVVPIFPFVDLPSVGTPTVTPPAVVTPSPPVITSPLTSSVTEGTAFSYTITATGTGPIFYDVVSPPAWLTGINHITGVISGIAPIPSTVNITITATNAGGTDSETLVVTVTNSVASMTAVRVSGAVVDSWLDRVNYKLYIIFGGSSVTDASGTYTRSQAACLDLGTALWTSWAPVVSSANAYIWSYPGLAWVYISGPTGVNGGSSGITKRVDKVLGTTNDPTFSVPNSSSDLIVDASITGGAIWSGFHYNGSQNTCYRLLSDGSLDATQVSSTAQVVDNCYPWAVNSSGHIIAGAPPSVSPGPPYQASAICRFNASTGLTIAATVGPDATNCRAEKDILRGRVICTGNFTAVRNMSGGALQSGLNRVCILAEDLSTFYPFGVTIADVGTERCGAIDPDSTNVFIGGRIVSVNGDTARKGIFKMTDAGALDTTFSPVFAGGNPAIYTTVVIHGVVFAMGDFGGATINGQAIGFFVALRTDTGALY